MENNRHSDNPIIRRSEVWYYVRLFKRASSVIAISTILQVFMFMSAGCDPINRVEPLSNAEFQALVRTANFRDTAFTLCPCYGAFEELLPPSSEEAFRKTLLSLAPFEENETRKGTITDPSHIMGFNKGYDGVTITIKVDEEANQIQFNISDQAPSFIYTSKGVKKFLQHFAVMQEAVDHAKVN